MNIVKRILSSRVSLIVACVLIGGVCALLMKTEKSPTLGEGTQETIVTTVEQPVTTGTLAVTPSTDPIFTVERDEAGTALASGNLLSGSRIGQWKCFHRNGATESRGEYRNNTRVGLWRFYYDAGEIRSEGRFNNEGKKDGLWTAYHRNGNVRTEGKYENDIRIGRWFAYPYADHADYFWAGSLDDQGCRVGNWTWYAKSRAITTDTYKDGRRSNRVNHTTIKSVGKDTAKPVDMEPEFEIPVFSKTDDTADATNADTSNTTYRRFRRR